ncbi:hypothetical protein BGX29_007743, partial [Mortierella sp. GBA35]
FEAYVLRVEYLKTLESKTVTQGTATPTNIVLYEHRDVVALAWKIHGRPDGLAHAQEVVGVEMHEVETNNVVAMLAGREGRFVDERHPMFRKYIVDNQGDPADFVAQLFQRQQE